MGENVSRKDLKRAGDRHNDCGKDDSSLHNIVEISNNAFHIYLMKLGMSILIAGMKVTNNSAAIDAK